MPDMHVIAIDPAPGKKSTVFDDSLTNCPTPIIFS